MTILHVRGVPEGLHERLRLLARKRKRSLSAEVIMLLSQIVEQEETQEEPGELLDRIYRNRLVPSPNLPSSTELIREDRER